MEIFFLTKEIWKGKSVTRAFLNARLSSETLKGNTIDIGGGKDTRYLSFMKKDTDFVLRNFDIKTGEAVDFENDQLPVEDNCYDSVIFLNVMEHIFNHQHIANEVVRITKPGGQMIGFVPFLMWYHPDHSDFFRYTHEALEIILKRAGSSSVSIESVAYGPFVAASQMLTQSLPKFLALPLFLIFYAADAIFLAMRPLNKGRYALGYLFLVKK